MKLTDLQNLIDQLALQQSESDQVVSGDQEAELRDALQQHPEWMDEMRSRESFDRRLRDTFAESPSDADGKERLLSLIAETPVSNDSSFITSANPADSLRRSRRRALGLITASTLLFAVS